MARILIATRTVLDEHSGSAFHLRNMIECLKNSGHEVYCSVFSNNIYDLPLTEDELKLFSDSLKSCYPNVVIADYSWMANVFDVVSVDILKICFVHDLRCRIVPCLEKIGYEDHYGWTEEKEAALLRKADILMVLSEEDEQFCKRMVTRVEHVKYDVYEFIPAKTIRIGIAMEPVLHDVSKETPGRCIFVCSGSKENEWALNWFHYHVWLKVVEQVPHATLDVVPGFCKDLDDRYNRAQLAVAPHIMQGGLKIKVAEAMAHCLTVVGNDCSFDGLKDDFFVSGESPSEMVAQIVFFIQEDEYRRVNGLTLLKYVKEKMTPQAAYGQLLDILV